MTSFNPLAVVQAQLDAYNAKDIDALLQTYASDAEQFTLHGELLAQGHTQLPRRPGHAGDVVCVRGGEWAHPESVVCTWSEDADWSYPINLQATKLQQLACKANSLLGAVGDSWERGLRTTWPNAACCCTNAANRSA